MSELTIDEILQCGSTNKYHSIEIRTWKLEDLTPSEIDTERAINEVQSIFESPLLDLHTEWHNREEGIACDQVKAEQWLKAQLMILDRAYGGNKVPRSAFASGY